MSANYFLGAPPLGQGGHLISLRIDDLSVYFEKKTGAEAMEIEQSVRRDRQALLRAHPSRFVNRPGNEIIRAPMTPAALPAISRVHGWPPILPSSICQTKDG